MSDERASIRDATTLRDEEQSPGAPRLDAAPSRAPVFGAAQRLIESFAVAVATSTGLYLVGSVYTDAFYGRMSIDAASLDFSPPHIALQSAHVLQSLLEYPTTLIVFYFLYRLLASRLGRMRGWYDHVRQRFGRLFLLLFNGVIVSPLIVAAVEATLDESLTAASSVLGEVGDLMGSIGSLLVLYVLWLSLARREDIITQIRQHKIIPIALLFALYLLDALLATADGAAADAELLMLGQTDASIAVEFAWSDDIGGLIPADNLILVTTRSGNYYVVERQEAPPSKRPVAYVVPFDSVDAARLQRINAADAGLDEFMFEMMGTPIAP